MTDSRKTPKSIFLAALDLPVGERQSYVFEACGDDEVLRRRVEHLLSASAESDAMLDQERIDLQLTSDGEANSATEPLKLLADQTGNQIGPYKLLQRIGEGGMGWVYMAEQSKPVERKVALKIIKPGMDSRQVIARFEAERQALALMDHPNIAKVLDAGTTDAGLPYFVMELVNGIPITEFCDQRKLTARERLELFVPVCNAVQHAHQKGIIHRDLKPANILVTLYDDHPVPKVIDFGVAKATSQKLTERTLFTQFGQIIGTLEYMSPEQAQRNQLDVDTRVDVYSLGLVLYELLTGTTPFDRKRMREAAFDEILRIIREEEPPAPSVRLSSIETLPSVSANRHTEPLKLRRILRGELDWIVLKSLEKDRTRRYQTANGFAADIQRYLADEPVVACPPSAAYRFRLVGFDSDGKRLFTVAKAESLNVWDRRSGDLLCTIKAPQRSAFSSLSISGDGNLIAIRNLPAIFILDIRTTSDNVSIQRESQALVAHLLKFPLVEPPFVLSRKSELLAQLQSLKSINESVRQETMRLINEVLTPRDESTQFANAAGLLEEGVDPTGPIRSEERFGRPNEEQIQLALKYARTACDIDMNNCVANVVYGAALCENEEYRESIEYLQRGCDDNHFNKIPATTALGYLARSLFHVGELEKAKERLAQARASPYARMDECAQQIELASALIEPVEAKPKPPSPNTTQGK